VATARPAQHLIADIETSKANGGSYVSQFRLGLWGGLETGRKGGSRGGDLPWACEFRVTGITQKEKPAGGADAYRSGGSTQDQGRVSEKERRAKNAKQDRGGIPKKHVDGGWCRRQGGDDREEGHKIVVNATRRLPTGGKRLQINRRREVGKDTKD